MFQINLRSNIKQIEGKLSAFAYKQLPFAQAQALTALAKRVVVAEQANEEKVLDRPKPFTKGALGVIRADKRRQTATVFLKDITARYLEPYEFGGHNVLNSKAVLTPVDAKKDLDQFGNLPRNFMKRLKGRADIYVGPIKTKSGTINGVWQRTTDAAAVRIARVGKNGQVRIGKTRKSLNDTGKLKLLIRFTDAHAAKQHLGWFGVAQHVISKEFNREFGKALAKAMATAK